MSKLRVLTRFRDESNFFLIHEVGDEIEVRDTSRAATLVERGLCEVVKEPKAESKQSDATNEAEQPAKRQYRRKKD